ncbi:hypothetical protein QI30_08265 [Kurthia sp. 3B1D]|uniref:SbsA Ig-like domain-containing protein n=2 Tax=Candidatus Kurthia intestinigallinarum TaxID=1562256 RepID=A0A433RUU8_9BACL|nr:hypothetical protein QI30_08265 [Kurthia sp. 3B1D]
MNFTFLYIANSICLFLFILHIFLKIKANMKMKRPIKLRPQNVDATCNWVILFDNGFNRNNLLNSSIYVLDEKDVMVPIRIAIKDPNTLIIHAPVNGYTAGKSYQLYLNERLDLAASSERDYKVPFNVY